MNPTATHTSYSKINACARTRAFYRGTQWPSLLSSLCGSMWSFGAALTTTAYQRLIKPQRKQRGHSTAECASILLFISHKPLLHWSSQALSTPRIEFALSLMLGLCFVTNVALTIIILKKNTSSGEMCCSFHRFSIFYFFFHPRPIWSKLGL